MLPVELAQHIETVEKQAVKMRRDLLDAAERGDQYRFTKLRAQLVILEARLRNARACRAELQRNPPRAIREKAALEVR